MERRGGGGGHIRHSRDKFQQKTPDIMHHFEIIYYTTIT